MLGKLPPTSITRATCYNKSLSLGDLTNPSQEPINCGLRTSALACHVASTTACEVANCKPMPQCDCREAWASEKCGLEAGLRALGSGLATPRQVGSRSDFVLRAWGGCLLGRGGVASRRSDANVTAMGAHCRLLVGSRTRCQWLQQGQNRTGELQTILLRMLK